MGTTRTSDTHPLWIDEVRAGDAGGLVGITFCPGKRGHAIGGFRWERSLTADLDVIALWNPSAMLTLIEDHEFTMLCVPALGADVRKRGITWHHMPITDVQPPDASFETAWGIHGAALVNTVRAGGRVLVHCRGGLGRAGTVAARILVELGHAGADAVDMVRAARPGAIKTRAQCSYVMQLAGDASKGAGAINRGNPTQGGDPHGLV